MFCKYCGAQNPDEAKFCRKCGQALTKEEVAQNSAEQAGATEQQSVPVMAVDAADQASGASGQSEVNAKPVEAVPATEAKATPAFEKEIDKTEDAVFSAATAAPAAAPGKSSSKALQGENVAASTKSVKKSAGNKPKKSKRTKVLVISLAALLLAASIVTVYFVFFNKITIDLNKYVIFSTDGCDGYGKAKVEVDWDAVETQYGDKLKLDETKLKKQFSSGNKGLDALINFGAEALRSKGLLKATDYLKSAARISLSKAENLANGDKVTASWQVAKDIGEYINCVFKYSDMQFEVKDLPAMKAFDPFADIVLTFEGISPNGTASFEYKGKELSESDFNIDKSSSLKEGDKVTISLAEDKEYYMSQINKIPSEITKTYEVKGLSSYVTDLSEISDQALAEMQEQAEDIILALNTKWENDEIKVKSYDYVGIYNLIPKAPVGGEKVDSLWGGRYNTDFGLVYEFKVAATARSWDRSKSATEEVKTYIDIRFHNLTIDGQKNIVFDGTDYDTPNEYFRKDIVYDKKNGYSDSFSIKGFPSISELKKARYNAVAAEYSSQGFDKMMPKH